MRKNLKHQTISYEESFQKSNNLLFATLNCGLTLNQMQLLSFAIFYTQKEGKTKFKKAEFEQRFGFQRYKTSAAKKDVQVLSQLQSKLVNTQNDYFEFINIFNSIKYDKGAFTFNWNSDIKPYILGLKEKYVLIDLKIVSRFKSSFSWVLYDYLRAHYGFWRKVLSKEELLNIFGVEHRETYKNHTGKFRQAVLDVAQKEINELTELEVDYKIHKKGYGVSSIELIWSTGTNLKNASQKQINELKTLVKQIEEDFLFSIDTPNQETQEQAIKLVKEARDIAKLLHDPISITKTKADILIKNEKQALKKLHHLATSNKDVYYNWLLD